MTQETSRQLLAEGALDWAPRERRTERYGSVLIQTSGSVEDPMHDPSVEYAKFLDAPIGQLGRLVADVTVTRESCHIGDVSRGLAPETPRVGEQIVLGEGELFVEENGGMPSVGVYPDDKRKTVWMDVDALYRVHSQTVRLFFEPAQAISE